MERGCPVSKNCQAGKLSAVAQAFGAAAVGWKLPTATLSTANSGPLVPCVRNANWIESPT